MLSSATEITGRYYELAADLVSVVSSPDPEMIRYIIRIYLCLFTS